MLEYGVAAETARGTPHGCRGIGPICNKLRATMGGVTKMSPERHSPVGGAEQAAPWGFSILLQGKDPIIFRVSPGRP